MNNTDSGSGVYVDLYSSKCFEIKGQLESPTAYIKIKEPYYESSTSFQTYVRDEYATFHRIDLKLKWVNIYL